MNAGYPRYVAGMIVRFAPLVMLALAVTACGGKISGGSERTTGSSGFTGKASISPSQNICPATRSCRKPAAGLTLVFSQHGQVVSTAKTGKDGSYRVGLPNGGNYVISVRGNPGIAPAVKPATATVSEGELKRLDLTIDIGIR
jgi:hypothetical protein